MVTKQDAVCTDCDPPRRFKSIPGLNGHMQFKHSKMPPTRHMNGRQARMYEELSDRLDRVLDQQEEILDLLRIKEELTPNELTPSNEAIGIAPRRRNGNGQGNGNGNDLAIGNGNDQGNGNGNGLAIGNGQADDSTNYVCEDCKDTLAYRQKHCGNCGDEIDWSGVPVDLNGNGA